MEFLLAIWLIFIMRYPEYRPKKSYLTWGLLAYLAAILVSCFTGVNFTLSFWGNAERMLGLFDILHFFIFYLILITVFRSWKDWKKLLIFSVSIAVLVSLRFLTLTPGLSLKHLVPYTSIGNTAYVSGYLIFNIFFTLLLWLRGAKPYRGWLYGLGIIIMLFEFWACHTSGAIIGLFASLLLLFFLLGVTHRQRRTRRVSLMALAILVVVVVAIFSQYQSTWFQHSFLRNLTPEKATFQTRLISWKSAADDFQYHPWFGVGLGNYAVIFDKHFDASFYNYATSDTYFDRAHNNIIDIASTTGLLGLLTYLSIFVAIGYYLVKRYKANGPYAGGADISEKRNLEILIIVALLTAYFFHNLAVFDSFVTYIGLMMILGFVYWISNDYTDLPSGEAEKSVLLETDTLSESDSAESKKYRCQLSAKWEWTALILILLATYLFASQYNIKPWRMFTGTIRGYAEIMQGSFSTGITDYKQALVGTHLDHDARVTLINLLDSNPQILTSLSKKEASSTINYVVSLAKENASMAPKDNLSLIQLAQTLDMAARYYYNDTSKFTAYSNEALQVIDRAVAASPGRVTVYLFKAQMQLIAGQNEQAITTAKYAISLNPHFYEGYCRLSRIYSMLKDGSDMGIYLTQCLDHRGASSLTSNTFIGDGLSYFASRQDYAHALILAKRLSVLNPHNAQILINLAKLYLIEGDQVKANIAAQKAISIDSSLNSSWASFEKTVNTAASQTVRGTGSATTSSSRQ